MNDIVKHEKKKLVTRVADRYGVDEDKMLTTLKNTAFKSDVNISNEQMMALLIVADQYNLNPFTKEIYAFPDKKRGGIVPVVGVDGWSRIINENPNCNGIKFNYADNMVTMDDAKPCPEWIECTIYRKDRDYNEPVREYLDEVYRPLGKYSDGNKKKPGPWQTHTKRFLRHKVLIQAARITMGFVGIFDQDEAERIIEAEVAYDQSYTDEQKIEFDRLLKDEDAMEYYAFIQSIGINEITGLFNSFPPKVRGSDIPGKTEMKEKSRKLEATGLDSFNEYNSQIVEAIISEDSEGVKEITEAISGNCLKMMIESLSPENQHKLKELISGVSA